MWCGDGGWFEVSDKCATKKYRQLKRVCVSNAGWSMLKIEDSEILYVKSQDVSLFKIICGFKSQGHSAKAFLSLVGDCTPVSPPQQLQRLPSFNGLGPKHINFNLSCHKSQIWYFPWGLALDRFGLTLSTALLPSGYTYQSLACFYGQEYVALLNATNWGFVWMQTELETCFLSSSQQWESFS